jgi:threonine synthase
MKFYNLNNKSKLVSLKEAVLTGIQGSDGLFMPETIPQLDKSFFDNLHNYSLQQIGYEVAKVFLSEDVEDDAIKSIVNDALNFEIPLVPVADNIYTLELFHGPTLAFKDVGARFMARLFAYFLKESNDQIHILVATSGDTGSAVANAFHNVPNIHVTILYPSGKVSFLQEQQLTTLGKNISALEIDGTFDDCQRMVKQAFADASLHDKITLASANSINLARLIPQSFYYFWAVAQHRGCTFSKGGTSKVSVCVPSGNFGNLTAGLIAKKMGLPVKQFIAATNVNDMVPKYLASGSYSPQPSQQTISNAMDVGNPSNFPRMMELYANDYEAVKEDIAGYVYTDDATRHTMKEVFSEHHYTLDPHGAVGFAAAEAYRKNNADTDVIFFETAHPAKFMDVVEKTLRVKIKVPDALTEAANKKKTATKMKTDYTELKSYLVSRV